MYVPYSDKTRTAKVCPIQSCVCYAVLYCVCVCVCVCVCLCVLCLFVCICVSLCAHDAKHLFKGSIYYLINSHYLRAMINIKGVAFNQVIRNTFLCIYSQV